MIFPDSWKIGCIKPIPKCPRPAEFTDLRPISLTPVIARLFERVVFDSFLSDAYHATLPNDQFGFRKGSSTTCALIKLLNDIHHLRRTNEYVRLFTLDMSKAFDTISHRAIINSLNGIQPPISPFLLNWYNSFLSSRVHFTLINGHASGKLTMTQGVPQGTIHGPPLFNGATAGISLPVGVSHCRLTKYADDYTPVIGGHIGTNDCADDVISCLEDQFQSRNLLLNHMKTKELLFCASRDHIPPTVQGIERVSDRKILGVIFDDKLSFKAHITTICQISVSRIYLLLRLKRLNYTHVELELLYDALVKSRLSYCASVWGGTFAYLLDRIDRVQRKAVRFGIIRQYEPIRDVIRNADQTLYQAITTSGETHLLYDLLPQRTSYATNILRPRHAGVAKTTNERDLRIFPSRFLKGATV